MTQVLQQKPNPYSEALAGVYCGILPAILLGNFASINTHEAFLMYLFLGIAFSLAVMYFTDDLTPQFAITCIGSYALALAMLTKTLTDNPVIAIQIMVVSALAYFALNILEHQWRKHHP